MNKRGRPTYQKPKNIRLDIRIDLDDYDKLNIISDETGLTKSEILRKSIDMMYDFYIKN